MLRAVLETDRQLEMECVGEFSRTRVMINVSSKDDPEAIITEVSLVLVKMHRQLVEDLRNGVALSDEEISGVC